MKIPGTINILGIPYRVERVNADAIDKGNAQIVPARQVIQIRNDLAPQYLEKTLLHEVIHGINFEASDVDTEWFANTLYAVLKQNDWLK